MTRESKLALIVGFGLILFVGILVSDHFSSGQRQEAAHLLAQRGALKARGGAISLEPLVPGLTTTEIQQASHGSNPPGGAMMPAPEPPVVEPARGRSSDEIVIGPGGARSSDGSNPSRATAPASEAMPSRATSTDPDGVKLHPVKEGETLYSICVAHYGDGSLWQALAEFNKSAVPNPARMRKGVTLRLPPIEVLKPGAEPRSSPEGARSLQSRPVAQSSTEGRVTGPPPATRHREGGAAATGRSSTHTVQRGETLSQIAERTLGSSRRWPDLVKANQDVIADPNTLVPGTVLRIPS